MAARRLGHCHPGAGAREARLEVLSKQRSSDDLTVQIRSAAMLQVPRPAKVAMGPHDSNAVIVPGWRNLCHQEWVAPIALAMRRPQLGAKSVR